MNKNEKIDLKKVFIAVYPFAVALIIMCTYLMPAESMINSSGDATDIWNTIKSMGTDDMYGSYVLYKGFNAVYPYVWLYRLSVMFGTNEWLFIKLFYSVGFSYVSAIGIPNMIEMLTGDKPRHYQKLLMVILCFYFWEYTMALSQLMVDLPCLMYFILLVNAALKIYKYEANIKNYIWTGFWMGLNLCASGQYTMPAVCIMIFLVIITVKKYRSNLIPSMYKVTGYSMVTLGTALSVRQYNSYFIATVVDGLREKGAWIPSASDWLGIGLTRFMEWYRVGFGSSIPSSRNMAIFQSHLGEENFRELYDAIVGGAYPLTIAGYIKIVLKYPIDFALCYLDKFFLALSPDQGGFHIIPLFLFYTLLYIALYVGFQKCKKIKNIFNAKFWIGFAFVWALVPCIIMTIEARFCMQIQGLVLGMAICTDWLWDELKRWREIVVMGFYRRKSETIGEKRMPYSFIIYCCFIILCLMHIGSLYAGIGVEAEKMLIGF